MMIYIAVWLIVLMVPVVSNFFELLSGKVEVMRWKGVLFYGSMCCHSFSFSY